MNKDLETVCAYVLASRKYANVYIKKNDLKLFNSVRYVIEFPYIGGVGGMIASSKPYGRSTTRSKCYLHWDHIPHKLSRVGKPVSTLAIQEILLNS